MARVEQEAADWIARLNAVDAGQEERSRFLAWRAQHPVHGQVYDGMTAVWTALESTDLSMEPFVAEATGAVPEDRDRERGEVGSVSRGRRRWIIGSALAASVLAAVGWYSTLGPRVGRAPAETILQTSLGEHVSIRLPDQSTIELNSQSRVRVSYSQQMRRIEIEQGEAFFDVAPDPARPFWVMAGRSAVRALGTAFGTYLRVGGIRVTVAQGSVQVSAADHVQPGESRNADSNAQVLKAGQVADLDRSSIRVHTLSDNEIARLLSWRSGRLFFENESLGNVAEELNRYTNSQFVIADEALRRLEIGGSFSAGPRGADALVHMLEDGFGLRARREGGRIYIDDPLRLQSQAH